METEVDKIKYKEMNVVQRYTSYFYLSASQRDIIILKFDMSCLIDLKVTRGKPQGAELESATRPLVRR